MLPRLYAGPRDGVSFDEFWLDQLYDGRPCNFELDLLPDIDPLVFNRLKQKAVPKHRALADARWLFDTICHLQAPKHQLAEMRSCSRGLRALASVSQSTRSDDC